MPVKSLSGRVAAWHTVGISVKDYRTFYDQDHRYLPVFYATDEDYDQLWRSKQVILTEGVFDRLALKLAFPDRAVFARLTKGVSPPMVSLLERLCSKVWIAFDNDLPGNKAADKASRRLGVEVHRLQIPYKDPSQFLASKGLSSVRSHYQRQIDALDF